MAANKTVTFGPVRLTNTNATTLVAPGTTTAYTNVNPAPTVAYCVIRHIRLVNADTVARTVSLFVGAAATAAAGTEFLGSALSIPANSFVDWYGLLRLDNGGTDAALCGGADVTLKVTLTGEGEVGLA